MKIDIKNLKFRFNDNKFYCFNKNVLAWDQTVFFTVLHDNEEYYDNLISLPWPMLKHKGVLSNTVFVKSVQTPL